jgi:hypothetical protein
MASLLVGRRVRAQVQVGHKVLGTLGLDAGSQPGEGLYAVDEFLFYHADILTDGNGNEVPAGFDGNFIATSVGLGATFKLRRIDTYFSAAAGLPAGRATVVTHKPPNGFERAGLGDLYVQPIKLGWRLAAADIVTSYGFYAPTGGFVPSGSGGFGQGQWTHELSGGGTLRFGKDGIWRVSALASLDSHGRKRGVDVTRGTSLQIQGGFGLTLFRLLDMGIASYALWEVSDDLGAQVPASLRGARDRAYGLGPEVDLTIPPVRGRVTLRFEGDLWAASRPLGQIFFVAFTPVLWSPPEQRGTHAAPPTSPPVEVNIAAARARVLQ